MRDGRPPRRRRPPAGRFRAAPPHRRVGWRRHRAAPAAAALTCRVTVAHLHGRLEIFDDEASLGDLVSRLSDRFEATVGSDWAFEPEREQHRSLLRGIVGFRLVPERIEMKFKLSQNHPLANRASVIDGLSVRDDADARAVAALMRATLP